MGNNQIIQTKNYPVYIREFIDGSLNAFLHHPEYQNSKLFLLVDENTKEYCLDKILAYNILLAHADIIQIPSGEENKRMDICLRIWKFLVDKRADRNSVLINLGGGVCSDLGGFCAGTFKRGIRYINIPTTLIAQVDAGFGGKVGFNLEGLKNQIGLFCDPAGVFIFTEFTKTLSIEQLRAGYAEMLKHALIIDSSYWDELKNIDFSDQLNKYKHIAKSVEIKLSIVDIDPYDRKERKLLNFGHTIGHALESMMLDKGYTKIDHGTSIAAGMICEAWLSTKVSGLPSDQLNEIVLTLKDHFQPVLVTASDYDRIVDAIAHDKKSVGGEVMFTLLHNIGKGEINRPCSESLIRQSLEYYNNLTRS